MKNDDGQAIYLYCLARAGLVTAIEGTGVDNKESAPFLHRFSDIAAVVSMVSLGEFCGPSAESKMRDLSWVGPRACRHEELVEQVMRHSPVLPIPFGTIFFSLQSLEDRLVRYEETISGFLDRVADKEEWAVKGFLDRIKARDEILSRSLAREQERLASLSPGLRYLQEKRMRASAEKELKGWARRVCSKIRDDLDRQASDFLERKVLSHAATGNNLEMILNWAFLVPRSAMEDFHLRVHRASAEYAPKGLSFELSGPWPPYSFSPSLETEQVS